ncbi:class I SAM-dependent methyltransferase [Streptomyces sodiiphilus]|uniref:Class I SAM-dependent methyltransferase n=1 Tax=Streptomyces sodiiphilus TaxID=226217 RepID=A0ABN2PM04_9ACTN
MLDLGAGTGLVSAAIRELIPDCELVLLDQSEKMLAKAEQRFAGDDAIRLVTADMAENPLPAGPFDAVVSGLAIHHLTHDGKRDLFARILRVLRPGGLFVNVEQVAAPTDRLEALYDQRHESHVQSSGTPAEEWAAGRERMKFDICADVESQLRWLRESGFTDVDCLAKDHRFATYTGRRP